MHALYTETWDRYHVSGEYTRRFVVATWHREKLRPHLNWKACHIPDDILTPDCAAWALRSCEKFLRVFAAKSGVYTGVHHGLLIGLARGNIRGTRAEVVVVRKTYCSE